MSSMLLEEVFWASYYKVSYYLYLGSHLPARHVFLAGSLKQNVQVQSTWLNPQEINWPLDTQ